MSAPPYAAVHPRRAADRIRLARDLPLQLVRSRYIGYFRLPARSKSRAVPLPWRVWSPGYDARADRRHVDGAIGTPESWRAALGSYRALSGCKPPPARYAELHGYWRLPPQSPSLYLYGRDDNRVAAVFAHWTQRMLPAGSEVAVIDRAGHFLQLGQPDAVAERVLAFIGA